MASSSIFLSARLAFFTLNSSVDSMARYSLRSPKGSSGEKQSEGSAGAGLWGGTCFAGYEHPLHRNCNAELLFDIRRELPVSRPVPCLLRQVVDFDLVVEVRALLRFSCPGLSCSGSATSSYGSRAILRGVERSGDVGGKR